MIRFKLYLLKFKRKQFMPKTSSIFFKGSEKIPTKWHSEILHHKLINVLQIEPEMILG